MIATFNASAGLPVTDQLQGHWDAMEGVALDGSEVSTWEDQSGNGNDWLRDTNGPSVVTAVLNGLDAVDFDGTDDLMSQTQFISGSSAGEMMCVCRRTTTVNKGWHTFGTSSLQSHFMHSDSLYETFGSSSRAGAISHNNDFENNEWGIYSVTMATDGTMTIRINGTQRYSASHTVSWNSTFYLGSGNNGGATGSTNSWQGQLPEMAVWDRELTSQERSDMFDFFNEKYALGL